jgi:small subunit ribosomal protein S11
MGKKHVIKKSEEELVKEGVKMETALSKEPKVAASSKKITEGKVYISSSYNNIIITLTDKEGNSLGWISSGKIGFKGSKKATPFAASKVAENISQIAQKIGVEKIAILAARGFDIIGIKDETPIPHNGCRPRKTRRV